MPCQTSSIDSVDQEREGGGLFTVNGRRVYPVLALYGGGEDGAYGAGLLCGWTGAGRPKAFKVVTGVSTGELLPSTNQ